ncbi:MAG: FecR family protein [Bacteroidales bacterium]|nr:FecR family protein [Bacteroidales bacterium]
MKSAENRKTLKEYKKAWVLGNLGITADENIAKTEKEFNAFKYRYLSDEKPHRKILNTWYIDILKYAAIVIVVSLLWFFLYGRTNTDKSMLISSFNEISTKPGERSQVTLADGSKIWLNACTKVKYPVDLNAAHLDIYLEGEAYFDLKKISGRSISVHTSRLKVDVLGTAFNLKSYTDENIIETTLVRGKISIKGLAKHKEKEKDKEIILEPNQTAVYFKSSDFVEMKTLIEHRVKKTETDDRLKQIAINSKSNIIVAESVNTDDQTSWVEGKFVFRKEPFDQLARRLERKFNVKIRFADEKLKTARFSGTFENETIEQALKALSYPVPFRYNIVKDSITILYK